MSLVECFAINLKEIKSHNYTVIQKLNCLRQKGYNSHRIHVESLYLTVTLNLDKNQDYSNHDAQKQGRHAEFVGLQNKNL